MRGDDIVWIDLGMVGQLSALERALIGRMFRAVAENDPYALMEALLGAVRSEGPVNHGRLLSQLGNLLVSYTTVNLADINVGSALMDVFGVLQTQNLALPPSFTLLARGMVTIEGVLVDIAPDTSVIDIIAAHVKRRERTWEAFETQGARVRLDRGDVRAGRGALAHPGIAHARHDRSRPGSRRRRPRHPDRRHRRALLRQRDGGYGAHLRRAVHRIEPACYHEHAPAVSGRAPAGRVGLRGRVRPRCLRGVAQPRHPPQAKERGEAVASCNSTLLLLIGEAPEASKSIR